MTSYGARWSRDLGEVLPGGVGGRLSHVERLEVDVDVLLTALTIVAVRVVLDLAAAVTVATVLRRH